MVSCGLQLPVISLQSSSSPKLSALLLISDVLHVGRSLVSYSSKGTSSASVPCVMRVLLTSSVLFVKLWFPIFSCLFLYGSEFPLQRGPWVEPSLPWCWVLSLEPLNSDHPNQACSCCSGGSGIFISACPDKKWAQVHKTSSDKVS